MKRFSTPNIDAKYIQAEVSQFLGGMHRHVGVYLIGFATFNANLIKNSHKPVVRAIHLSNFWETSAYK
jgi:hypothetical protein